MRNQAQQLAQITKCHHLCHRSTATLPQVCTCSIYTQPIRTYVVIVIAIPARADCCRSQRLHVFVHALAHCVKMLILLVAQAKHSIMHTLRTA